ncbi:MAG: sodium-dependent transporter [Parvularculaceae bacterium]|nr:sodium-dependent transporter [Parvularculaceae bacterium]
MNDNKSAVGPTLSSGASFVFVASGMAIGLGNIWRFPFLAGEHGGGAFVLVYLAAVFLFGLPIIAAEIMIGRRGRGSPGHAVRALSEEARASRFWRVIGWLCVLIPFVGIAYYSVVAGWVVDYAARFIAAGGLDGATPDIHQSRFDSLLASPLRVVLGHTVFMFLVVLIVARGVTEGLERFSRLLMPLLFALMIALAIYASVTGDFAAALRFLFAPDFSKLTAEAVAAACGQAFFSLGVGLGALMAFGAYLPDRVSIAGAGAAVAAADTSFALIAGLAIFPIMFALGIDPAAGPGLVFVSMPAAFANMPAGYVIGSAFFILVFIAALTTGVGTIEPVVAWLERKGVKRVPATIMAGAGAWFVGLGAAFSFNILSDVRLLAFIPGFAEKSIFDILDFAIASLLLPLNGLLIALFAGWALSATFAREELGAGGALLKTWRYAIRFVAPVGIVAALWLAPMLRQ